MTFPERIMRPAVLRWYSDIVKHHPGLTTVVTLYLILLIWLSFWNFHHVNLGNIAGINYQARFEADTLLFKLLNAIFLSLPVWCLYIEIDITGHPPLLSDYLRRYGLSIILAFITACLVFYWRQIPDVVSGEGRQSMLLALIFWSGMILFHSLLRTVKNR